MKVCMVSSSGGHWEELICMKELAERYDSFFITECGDQAKDSKIERLYTVNQINRHEKRFAIHFVKLFFRVAGIIRREKPDVVVTTGALIAFPVCLLAKLRGAKIIYIESFARVYEKSLTGRLVYPFADLFLVQWESLLEHYPKAKYVGGIF